MGGKGAPLRGGGLQRTGHDGMPHPPPRKLAFLCAISQVSNIGNKYKRFLNTVEAVPCNFCLREFPTLIKAPPPTK